MRKIYTYPLEVTDYQTVEVKGPAILLSVAEQNNQIVMYAMADDLEYGILVDVRRIGTGNPRRDDIDNCKFLGTVKLANGGLMFHVFARHSNNFTDTDEKKEDIPVLRIDEFVNIKEKRMSSEMIMV